MRLKNYTIGRKLKDEEVLGPGGLNRIAELIRSLLPFVSSSESITRTTMSRLNTHIFQITYLNDVVMPDDPAESDSDEEEEDNDEANSDN